MRLRAALVMLMLGLVMGVRSASATPIVSVLPSVTNVGVGDSFSVDIDISGALDLYSFQFDFGFNPAILAANDTTPVVYGDFLGNDTAQSSFPFGGFVDPVAGTISFILNSKNGLVPGNSGSGVLATLNFVAIGAGTSDLIVINPLFLAFHTSDPDEQGEVLDPTFENGSVTATGGLTPVPEPGTLMLVGSGLAMAWRKRRHLTGGMA